MLKVKIILGLLSFSVLAVAQNIPIDFETGGHGADWTWTTFENTDNPPLEIVDNPSASGINSSSTVAKFTARADGNPWAGCESKHGSGIGNYQITASNSTITIMVYKTVISDVGIKLVTSSGWSKGELKVANTKVNEWEELSFDFSKVDHEGMTYDQIVIFPDFKDRSEDQVSYFDNFTIGGRTASLELVLPREDKIYPNPTPGMLQVTSNSVIQKIEVFDLLGQLIFVQNEINESQSTSVDLSKFTNGVYMLNVKSIDGSYMKKIIKE